jgi:hypothetical protein
MNLIGTIKHPQSSKNKFVYSYKTTDGDVYYSEDGKVKYFDTQKQARETCGNKPCWSIGIITNPLGN